MRLEKSMSAGFIKIRHLYGHLSIEHLPSTVDFRVDGTDRKMIL